MQAWNAPSMIRDKVLLARPDVFEVLPENWPTIELFLAVCTQWRFGGMGGLLGLDYPAVDVAVRYLELTVGPDSFAGLQVMEQTVVSELSNDAK